MEILKLIALLIGAALLLGACSYDGDYTLSYQEKSFTADLSWCIDGTEILATLVSIRNPDASRDLSLSFTYPPSLAGITVTQTGEDTEPSARLGDIEISSPAAVRWLAISQLFELEGEVKNTFVTSIDGVAVNAVEASTERGDYTVYLMPDNSLPRRISGEINGKNISLDIILFEISP